MTKGTTFAQLLAELKAADTDPRAFAALVEVFRAFDGQRVRISAAEIEPIEREEMAARLLALGEPRATIRERLQRRFRVSRSTAYRAIDAALNRRQVAHQRPERGTQSAQDRGAL